MAERLNMTLSDFEGGIAATPSTRDGAPTATVETKTGSATGYDELKALVIKTADEVYRKIQTLSASLSGEYIAQSDFGTYMQQLNLELEANPEAITQYFSFYSNLSSNIEALSNSFSAYKVGTEAYIKTGIVYYDGATPIYGVAVGQNLTTREVDGETIVEQNNFRATFTATKLSFWQDDQEVAYVSNNQLYITSINVTGSLVLDGKWQITAGNNNLSIQWVG